MTTLPRETAVIIIGGGIAGTALACNLADADIPVVLLERQKTYRDRVRGEVLNCWGIQEARELGVDEAFVDRRRKLRPPIRRIRRNPQPRRRRSPSSRRQRDAARHPRSPHRRPPRTMPSTR